MNDSFIAARPEPLRVLRNDAIAALLVGAVMLIIILFLGFDGAPELYSFAIVSTSLAYAALALRRSAPLTALWCTTIIAGAAQGVTAFLFPTIDIAVLMAVYAVAAFAPRRYVYWGFAPMVAALAMLLLQIHGGMPWINNLGFQSEEVWREPVPVLVMLLMVVFAFIASWALGMNRRGQLREVVDAQERAALLERDQQRLTEIVLSDERSRISREMHDIIAHSLASIVTLAEGGRLSSRTKPELTEELFGKIAVAGRDALGDIKLLLSRVDSSQDDAPMKGVDDLHELVSSAKLAGVPIEFIETGSARPLPKGLSLAVFRVGQECLTNMYKHAPGARAELQLDWSNEHLQLRSFNERTQPTHAISSDRRGLAGMRERAELFGGTFNVHETETGFEILARWPLDDAELR